jgi:hypothetical protein
MIESSQRSISLSERLRAHAWEYNGAARQSLAARLFSGRAGLERQ